MVHNNKPLSFDDQLVAALPQLRRNALKLTRNAADANDLVQDAVINALNAWGSFIPGSNFSAWIATILRNKFISGTRKGRREIGGEAGETIIHLKTVEGNQIDRLDLLQVMEVVRRLPADQLQALRAIVFKGMSYDEFADSIGIPSGTAKSQVNRAREFLKAFRTSSSASGVSGAVKPRTHNGVASPPAEIVHKPIHVETENLQLSPQQQQVFVCLIQGMRNKEISARLNLNAGMVGYYITELYKKIGINGRKEAHAWRNQQRLKTAAQSETIDPLKLPEDTARKPKSLTSAAAAEILASRSRTLGDPATPQETIRAQNGRRSFEGNGSPELRGGHQPFSGAAPLRPGASNAQPAIIEVKREL